MQTALKNYLLQFEHCAVKGVGQLVLQPHTEVVPQADKFAFTHSSKIIFVPEPMVSSRHLEQFLEASKPGSAQDYTDWCTQIGSLKQAETKAFADLGRFKLTVTDVLEFENFEDPDLQRTLLATRVLRNHASHHMLVGDTETNSATMAEKLGKQEVVNDKWWIPAAIIATLSILAILFYYFGGFATGHFGYGM